MAPDDVVAVNEPAHRREARGSAPPGDRLGGVESKRADPPIMIKIGAQGGRRAVAPANEGGRRRCADDDRTKKVAAGIQQQEVDEVLEAGPRVAVPRQAL